MKLADIQEILAVNFQCIGISAVIGLWLSNMDAVQWALELIKWIEAGCYLVKFCPVASSV